MYIDTGALHGTVGRWSALEANRMDGDVCSYNIYTIASGLIHFPLNQLDYP